MAQRGSRKRRSRKRSRSTSGAQATPPEPRPPSRSEAKNQAVRESLVPLREGERPLAVTIGAIVAFLLAIGNLAAYSAGLDIGGERPPFVVVAGQGVVMLVAAWGMWRARYWAVLGMQALLGILIVIVAITGLLAENLLGVLVVIGIIVPAGALFWFLVKAMARIQMPERR